jgi:hypothetical protein
VSALETRHENIRTLSADHRDDLTAYLRDLSAPKALLWCYLLWWAAVAIHYFDPNPTLWLNSLGLSLIIGTGLYLSTAYAGATRRELGFWPVARFYVMPFCCSSFSALIKGRGFVLIFDPDFSGNLLGLSLCGAFGTLVVLLKCLRGSTTETPELR